MTHSLTPVTWTGNREPSGGSLTEPQNFSATGGDTTVDLTWDSVAGATDYEVRVDAGAWTSTGNITGYQFQGLTNGQQYTFDVRATNAQEDGPPSTTTGTPTNNQNKLSGGYTPLTIVSPETVSPTSRFANAFPGIQYSVSIGVTGGYFPYTYELTANPVGMTIDQNTGDINWPIAQTEGSSYTVTVRVTDNNGDQVTKTWPLLVTTNNFYFVDSVNGTPLGSGGTGTFANPWANWDDVHGPGSKFSTNIPDGIIYFMNGNYDFSNLPIEDAATDPRIAWYVDRKAKVWLAYPGHFPVHNCNVPGADAYLSLQFSDNDFYCEGIDWNNNGNDRGKTISCSPLNNWVFRNNNFRGLTTSIPGGNNSHIFFSGGSGRYAHVVGNTNPDNNTGYFMLHYNTQDVLIERNVISGSCPLPLGPKDDINTCTMRQNIINCADVTSGAIWVQEFGSTTGNIEICFNKIILPGSSDMGVSLLTHDNSGEIWVYRNNIVGHVEAWSLNSTKGPWNFIDNVIINDSPEADKITRTNVTAPERLIVDGNLTGVAADNILDANGNFTPAYQSNIGQKGAEVVY